MSYDKLTNSENQSNDRQNGWDTPCSIFTLLLFSPQPQKHASTIWSFTQSLLWADQTTISRLKEEILGYVRIQKILIFLLNRCCLSQVQNTSFQHAFLVCWGLAASLNIWDCHSATCWCRSGHHMANEREHPQLSYQVWKVDFHRQVAGIRRSYLFK